MNSINKTVIDSRILSLEIVDAAAKSGQVLSVLIAPAGVKFFCKAVIVEFKPLPAEKVKALAVALKNRSVPFCAYDKALGGTLGSIPAEHLRGEAVVAKVYPPAQPATRPVVKAAGAPAPVVEAKAELPAPAAEQAKDEPAPKEKKAARGEKKLNRGKKTVAPKKLSPEGAKEAVG